jgi:branched-chain amino acid aminotransferase
MDQFCNLNGKVRKSNETLIHPDNRAFRYGEGLFETIRLHQSEMPLWNLHWQRLQQSIPQLYFLFPPHFNSEFLKSEVIALVKKNKCSEAARVRITIFKGEGGVWETPSTVFNYLIQCWPLENKIFTMNENGLDMGVFTDGWKSCDAFSNLKNNSYLVYAMAAQFAREQKWNEAIVLNQHSRICDTTIANLFFVMNHTIHTPHLKEGCVNGVMRKFLLEQMKQQGIKTEEGSYSIDELLHADEVFLTNAMYGIRWVKQYGNKTYGNKLSSGFFQKLIAPLFV